MHMATIISPAMVIYLHVAPEEHLSHALRMKHVLHLLDSGLFLVPDSRTEATAGMVGHQTLLEAVCQSW